WWFCPPEPARCPLHVHVYTRIAPRHEVAPGWFVGPRRYPATNGPDRAARPIPRLLYQSSGGAIPAGASLVLLPIRFHQGERFGLFPKFGTCPSPRVCSALERALKIWSAVVAVIKSWSVSRCAHICGNFASHGR